MTFASSHSRAAAAYRGAEAHPPVRQITLLHDSAIQRLEQAKAAIGERRIEARFQLVMKAYAIVGALQSCLDFEQGGEIAPMLDRLYGHMLGRLTAINLRNDPAICDELISLLGRLRDGWAAISPPGWPDPTPPPPPAGTARGPAALTA
jgi:flagellar biosynthetic protein FliS